jgi:hypothetical protein
MPSKLVKNQFLPRFDGIVDVARNDKSHFYWLVKREPNLNESAFFDANPLYRARCIATAGYCYGKSFKPMCDFFRVSPTALAIQLIDLGLVR